MTQAHLEAVSHVFHGSVLPNPHILLLPPCDSDMYSATETCIDAACAMELALCAWRVSSLLQLKAVIRLNQLESRYSEAEFFDTIRGGLPAIPRFGTLVEQLSTMPYSQRRIVGSKLKSETERFREKVSAVWQTLPSLELEEPCWTDQKRWKDRCYSLGEQKQQIRDRGVDDWCMLNRKKECVGQAALWFKGLLLPYQVSPPSQMDDWFAPQEPMQDPPTKKRKVRFLFHLFKKCHH